MAEIKDVKDDDNKNKIELVAKFLNAATTKPEILNETGIGGIRVYHTNFSQFSGYVSEHGINATQDLLLSGLVNNILKDTIKSMMPFEPNKFDNKTRQKVNEPGAYIFSYTESEKDNRAQGFSKAAFILKKGDIDKIAKIQQELDIQPKAKTKP